MKSPPPYLLLSICCLLGAAAVRAQDEDRPAAPAPETAAAEPAAPRPDRVTFSFKLSGERGGGQATGSAGDFEYQEGQYLIATGGVDFKYQGLRLQAERARIDIPTNLLTAEGDVILDEGPQRLAGQTLEYDLDTRTGKVTEATAHVAGDYYFTGAEIAKTGDVDFTVDKGIFTSCEQEVPSWSLQMSSARITLEEYVRVKNARLKFKRLPVLYSPYLVWPANTERSSGLLVPKPGFSNRRGTELSMAYFKTLGRSADTTFLLDLSTEEYYGFGNETRYRPSERTEGYFRAYVLAEPELDETSEFFNEFTEDRDPGDARWKVELQHETRDLWGGFRGVVSFRQYSDLDYLQDYERDADRQRQPYVYSNAFLSGNFGPHSLNILVDQRERIVAQGRKDLRHQLPEVEYKLRKLRLGKSLFYLDLQSSLNYFSLDLENPFTFTEPDGSQTPGTVFVSQQYGRLDLSPTLSISLSSLNWLSAEVELGGRATHYTDSLTPAEDVPGGQPRGFSGDALTRIFPRAGLEVVGPSFLRIFDAKIGRFAKFKHVVEPRVEYSFVGEFDEQGDIFRFDEIDNLRPADGFLFSLINRLVAKPADEDQGGAIEIASLTVSQGLSNDLEARPGQVSSVDPTIRSREGPLGVTLRFNPSRATSFKVDAGFNTLFDGPQLQSFRLSGSTKLGRHTFGLSWFSSWRIDLDRTQLMSENDVPVLRNKTSDQAQFSTKLDLLRDRLSLESQLSFDILGPVGDDGGRQSWDLQQQRYFLHWKSQCYSWQLEYRESNYRQIEDRDVRFSLTLKNVGTFLDLNESF